MTGWVIHGTHLGKKFAGFEFYIGYGGFIVHLDSLDESKVYSTREGCRRKMCAVRKENRLHAEHFKSDDDLCAYEVMEVTF